MVRSLARLRVDQVGSLVRPGRLRRALADHQAEGMTTDQLRMVEDEAIREVVGRQSGLGFPVVGDGEFRRSSFADSFADVRERTQVGHHGLELERNRPLDEFRFAQALTGRPVKVTLLSVDRVLRLYGSNPFSTSSEDAFVSDVVGVQRQIVEQLVAAGCRYLQMDGPGYAAYTDPAAIAEFRGRGRDPLDLLRRAAASDSAVVDGFDEITFGMHLCHRERARERRGDLLYDGAAEVLFECLPHQRLLLECDGDRVSFEALRFVPRDKVVVLGLVSTSEPRLEQEELLLRRIDEASRFVPVEQLAISPQCGFAPVADQGSCSEADQWRKLELVLRVAERVWGTGATSEIGGASFAPEHV